MFNKQKRTIIISEKQIKLIQESLANELCCNKLGVTIEGVKTHMLQSGPFHGLYPGAEDDMENGEGIYPFTSEEDAEEQITAICQKFASFENPFPVWRSINVDKLTDIQRNDLVGNSWTFDHDSAISFGSSLWGDSGNTILKAECPFDAVDWVETISRYIQDNNDETKFNDDFNENEIFVETPGRLINVEVCRTTLTEGVDPIQNILNEIKQIPYDKQVERGLYLFTYDSDGTPKYTDNVSYHTINTSDRTGTVEEWYNEGGELVFYHQKSGKRGEGYPSEYYQTPPDGNVKTATRGSDHWSYYIIRDYDYRGKKVTLVINDCRQPIKNLYYVLDLTKDFQKDIAHGKVDGIVQKQPKRKFTLGDQTYIVLEKDQVARYLILARYKNYVYGTTIISATDTAIFPYINDLKIEEPKKEPLPLAKKPLKDPIPIIKKSHMLSENRESKNLSRARKFLRDHYDNTEEEAIRIVNSVRHDIPNSRLYDAKYLLGICRMYVERQILNAEQFLIVNKTLKFLAGHEDEYDHNLNGMSAGDFVDRFKTVAKYELEKDKANQKQYENRGGYNGYKITPINQESDVFQFAKYAEWCITQGSYEAYTKGGLCKFYVLTKEGFEITPKEQGKDCPLDEYGLSMIAVSVDDEGALNTVTTRWNHANGGNDNIMTTTEISDLIGANFYNVFQPITITKIYEDKKFEVLVPERDEQTYIVKDKEVKQRYHLQFYNDGGSFTTADNHKIINSPILDNINATETLKKFFKDNLRWIYYARLIYDSVRHVTSVNVKCKPRNDTFLVSRDNEVGLLNKEGGVILPLMPREGSSINDSIGSSKTTDGNYIVYRPDDKWGVVDYNGNIIIPFIYSYIVQDYYSAEDVVDDNYIATFGNQKLGVINPQGQEIIPFEYDRISFEKVCYFLSTTGTYFNSQYKVADLQGNIILPDSYDNLQLINDSTIEVTLKREKAHFDLKGNMIKDWF